MAVLLSVQGLTKAYGVRPLFTELTFDLSANERVGLIGPNGAGKSTLLKILAGKEELDSGTRSLRRATKMGFVAQDDVFPEGLSVQDIVRARLDGESLEDHEKETRISKVLTRTGFDDFDKPAHLLSGGWRKRLGIAREMALEPDLLLLDEPTNHLDIPGIVCKNFFGHHPLDIWLRPMIELFCVVLRMRYLKSIGFIRGGFIEPQVTMMNSLTIERSF